MKARGRYVLEAQKFGDFDLDIEVKIKEPVVTVSVTDPYLGISARGSAKRNDPDLFSLEVGRTIAMARALGRFARRVERSVIRNLDEST